MPTDVAELAFESGTEVGVGFNLGLLACPTENLSFGLAYRHEVTIDHDAQADFVQILTGNQAVDDAVKAALPPSQPGTASFTYPGSIAAGVALRRGYWTFEVDFQWMLWSSFDAEALTFANSPAFDTVLPQEWESTWRGAFGVEYLIRDTWEVRGGYGYDHSPAPTETISPFIHDADRHTFGAGGTWKNERMRLDFNARYVLFRESSTLGISRYNYNGAYDTEMRPAVRRVGRLPVLGRPGAGREAAGLRPGGGRGPAARPGRRRGGDVSVSLLTPHSAFITEIEARGLLVDRKLSASPSAEQRLGLFLGTSYFNHGESV